MTARFCACNENKAASAKKTTAIACRMGSCVATQAGGNAPPTSGRIAFLGVFSTHYMAEVGGYRFVVTIQLCNNIIKI